MVQKSLSEYTTISISLLQYILFIVRKTYLKITMIAILSQQRLNTSNDLKLVERRQ